MSEVAKRIFRRLGGKQFQRRTGATNFIPDHKSLMFSIEPMITKNGVRDVHVEQNKDGTYTIVGYRAGRSHPLAQVDQVHNINEDGLPEAFRHVTGIIPN